MQVLVKGKSKAFVENANSLARTGPLWVFFDEINTCNHMGLLTSIITDRSLYGQSLSDNLRFFAACNPYRLRKIPTDAADAYASKEYFYEEQSKLVYQVHPVPEALLDYIWDYGVLSPLDENLYTQHMVTHSMSNFAESQMFAEMLCMSQEHIRSIDGEHSVSLRDIKRAIELARFFRQSLESRAALKTKRASYPQADDIPQRSMVLALVVSYQCRLYRHEDRRKYRENLGNIFAKFKNPITTQGILEIFHHDAIDYFNRMICGDDVAPSEALLENMLATIACILTNIPIFVVGAPGSSKSLALKLINQNLRGADSNDPYFAHCLNTISRFHYVHVCGSTKSVSKGNEVSRDELEATSYQISRAIGRGALLVQRPSMNHIELADVGIKIYQKEAANRNADPPPKELFVRLTDAFIHYQKSQSNKNFHGLRDYYSLVKTLGKQGLSREAMQNGLLRNFGGAPCRNSEVYHEFENVLAMCHTNGQKRDTSDHNILEIIDANLQDSNSRHLMLIGDKNSVVDILNYHLKSYDMEAVVLWGSQYPEDNTSDYAYSILNKVLMCVEQGQPVVLTNLKAVYGELSYIRLLH
ncbi:hypothetical protein K493DRAFT_305613 [Basidiobolus meristosporus CBS 931.73]|uniref:P-loop containing nucleoside triphosphate hydrolase protein n=1 Tax=Basidiobolus meristosporus CBS 931.73 TaxID=1314790 RepID=A0A1Y1XW95_9FUNG|nr:hypothetical protein K493DRAFT_305613 [Basidiobolus meristosporus CBS 931.73]|eukprot:ORX89604.1 hypothetical protein K493DRAFT_305613 [Basidiobolus meristosporus CBS 931.73]